MKLYVYDHCPFCVRARAALGLKGIDADVVYLPNHDEKTPISMIGEKMLPILEDKDGFMGESLDIVHKLDTMTGDRLFEGEPSKPLTDWLSENGSDISALVIPRAPDPVFAEFRTPEAVAYFTRKKESSFGDFGALIADTDAKIAAVEAALERLVPFLPDPSAPSIDDIIIFPFLRGLTVVEGLTMPTPVQEYLERMSEMSGVPLVWSLRAKAA